MAKGERQHQRVQRQLAFYRDLAPAARAAVDGHLAGCAACRAWQQRYQQQDHLLAARPLARPDQRLAADFYAATAGAAGVPAGLGWLRQSAGALVLLLVVLGAWLTLRGQLPAAGTPWPTLPAVPESELAAGRQFNSEEPVLDIAISGDSQMLAVLTPATLTLWETATGRPRVTWPVAAAAGDQLVIDPLDRYLGLTQAGGAVRWWALITPAAPQQFDGDYAGVSPLAFARSRGRLAWLNESGAAEVHAVGSGELIVTHTPPAGVTLTALGFLSDGGLIAGSRSGAFYHWPPAAAAPGRYEGRAEPIVDIVPGPGGQGVAIVYQSGAVQVWPLPLTGPAYLLPPGGDVVWPASGQLVQLSDSGRLLLWGDDSGQLIKSFTWPMGRGRPVFGLTANGFLVAQTNAAGVRLWLKQSAAAPAGGNE